jgi:hypothetical protein
MQYIIYDDSYQVIAWIDTNGNDILLSKGMNVIASQENLSDCVLEPTPYRGMMVVPELLKSKEDTK